MVSFTFFLYRGILCISDVLMLVWKPLRRPCFVFFFLVTLGLSGSLFMHGSASMEIDAQGKVTDIVDGDTLDVEDFGRIRLADIDAPESWEPGYSEAKNYLSSLVENEHVYIDKDEEKDPYDRFVCVIYLRYNSTHLLNVNQDLLTEGVVELDDYSNEFDPSTWTLYVYHPLPEITSFRCRPSPFSPNGDGKKDTTTIDATFSTEANWVLKIKRFGAPTWLRE